MADPVDHSSSRLPSADSADLATSVGTPSTSAAVFPIVGIGASAGGLEACTQVLAHLPVGIALALILVQHLDPTHASILPERLSRVTPLPVRQVQDGTAVQPSHVYVVPPNVTMTIAGGVLRLAPRREVHGPHMPIDHFFRSLAADQGSHAIGIILSGTGSDGALGLGEIKERGGIGLVQDEQTAKFAGMPHSALLHATVDFILPPEGIAQELRRFFVKVDVRYQITNAIREMCTFARHDLCRDAPFSNMDLVSCRNVLIYLDAVMQRRIMPLFHYALHPGGFLMLGTAETLGSAADLFTPVDPQHKIYAKVASALRPPKDFTLRTPWEEGTDTNTRSTRRDDAPGRGVDVFTEADRVIRQVYGPTGVLINEQMDILQFRGDTSHYRRPAPGKARLNLLQMGREGLLIALRAAMADAQKIGGPVSRAGVQIAYEGQTLSVTLRVLPLTHPPPPASHYMVLFEEAALPAIRQRPSRLLRRVRSWWSWGTRDRRREGITSRGAGTPESSALRDELEATKQSLHAAIEQCEATNEELRAGSEEILSANEELQSTNEALETAKEELQSANEELTTINEELRGRNVELAQAHNDLHNLFSSGHLPIVMLDRDLRIRRVTATAEQVLHILPTDVGRPLTHLNLTIPLPEVETVLVEVLDTGRSVEREVQDWEGRWYSLRIHPYRTTAHTIDGTVLVVIDIHSVKDVDRLTHLLVKAQAARQFAEAVVETVREPLVVLDDTWRVITANAAFYRTFQVTKEATERQVLYALGHRQWDIPELRTSLEALRSQDTAFEEFAVAHDFSVIGRKHMLLNARRTRQAGAITMLLAIEDVTEQTDADERLKASLTEKEVLLREIHHRVKNNLQIIESLLSLQFGNLQDPVIRTLLEDSRRRIGPMALVHEQLYTSADLARIDLGSYVKKLTQQLSHTSVRSGRIGIHLQADEVLLTPDAAIPCGLILTELLATALKYAFPAGQPGEVHVELGAPNGQEVTMVVRDTGVGFPEALGFRHTASLGLQLVCMLTEQLHGTITLERRRGTTFTLTFPIEPTS